MPPKRLSLKSRVISIHALREESDLFCIKPLQRWRKISIHALREESDHRCCQHTVRLQNISIHALREESDSSISAQSSK